MLNVDDRILSSLNECEMYLVLHIAKYMKSNRLTAWPSIPTLSKCCGWDERTVKKWRQTLIDKGFLSMTTKPGKPTVYRFLKDGIGIYTPMKDAEAQEENEGAEIEGGTKNEGAFFDVEGVQKMQGVGVQKMYPEVIKDIKSEIIKEENADANAPLPPPFKKTGEIEIPETNLSLNAEKEKNLQSGAGGGGAPGGQNGAAVRISLTDPDLPGVQIVDEVKPEPQTPPEKTGRGKQTRTSEQLYAAQEVIDEINRLKGGRAFRINEGDNAKEIIGRLKQGATVDEMKFVVQYMWNEWGNNPEMRRNYNPITLFRNCNFYRYLTAAEDRRNNPIRPEPNQQPALQKRDPSAAFWEESPYKRNRQ